MSSADSQEVPPDALKSRKKSFRMILDDHIAERDWDSLSILHDLAKEDEATGDGEANAATTGGGHVDDDSPIAKAANANLERLQILAETAHHAESGSSGPGTPRGEGESAANKKGRSVEVISSSEDEREEREEMNSKLKSNAQALHNLQEELEEQLQQHKGKEDGENYLSTSLNKQAREELAHTRRDQSLIAGRKGEIAADPAELMFLIERRFKRAVPLAADSELKQFPVIEKIMNTREWILQTRKFERLEAEYAKLRQPSAKLQFLKLQRAKALRKLEKHCDIYTRCTMAEGQGYKEVLSHLIPLAESKPEARKILERQQYIRAEAARIREEQPHNLYATLRQIYPVEDWVLRAIMSSIQKEVEWNRVAELLEKQIKPTAREQYLRIQNLEGELANDIKMRLTTDYLMVQSDFANISHEMKFIEEKVSALSAQKAELEQKLQEITEKTTKLQQENKTMFEEVGFGFQARKQIPDKINEAEEKARRVLSALNLQETQLIEKIEENKKKKIELSAEYDRTKEELHLSRDDFEKEVAKNTKVFYKLRAAKPSVSTKYEKFYIKS